MVAELSHRGGLSSTTQAPCESTDSIDLPQTDEPSLQILLAAYVQAVTVEEEEPNKEEVTAVRGRSKVRETFPSRPKIDYQAQSWLIHLNISCCAYAGKM
jgi:hypothetical protein